MKRLVGLLVLGLVGSSVQAAPADAAASATPRSADAGARAGAGPGFHLEGPPAIDDVFGDSSDYRRTVDRFLQLTTQMQRIRDQFARSAQAVLAALAHPPAGRRHCPAAEVAGPYARAHRLGGDYLRVGRELTRHYDEVKELDRLGESVGLTPDYRWKVKRVLNQYSEILTDYREMKVQFHDELDDELKFAGCDLAALLQTGDPEAATPVATADEWPQPGTPGAPGTPIAKPETKVDPKLESASEAPPPTLPVERVPPAQPIRVPRHATAPADPTLQPRSGMLFYVDNTRCQRSTTVWLDGKPLGDVPAGQRVGFQTVPGPHDLCLLDSTSKTCGAPGTVRRSYLHEGWTISLRCE